MCYDIPFVVGFCLSFCILFMSCISYHVIMCIAFAYVFVSCIRTFSPLSVLQSGAPISSGAPLLFSFVSGCQTFLEWTEACQVALVYTGRPPVKFRSIWRSFGTPTVNRVTQDAFCVVQQNPLSKQPKTHQTLFHALGRSITIVWAKTHLIWSLLAPSTYKYVGIPKNESQIKP